MTAFQLSINGRFPFVLPTPDVLDRVRRWLRATERVPYSYDLRNSGDLDFDVPTMDDSPGLSLYELFVPICASRWSVFRGLMHVSDVNNMTGTGNLSVYYLSGLPTNQSVSLSMNVDGVTLFTKTGLYVLPPMPLTGLDGAADLYLITLVDGRYYAQFGSVITGGTNWTTNNNWTQLISTALDQAIGNPSYSFVSPWPPISDYGQPDLDSDFYSWAGTPGALADAALSAVGRVLCGDYHVTRWVDANTAATTARAAAASNRIAGGVVWPQHTAGTTELPLVAHLPQKVQVIFPWWTDGFGYRDTDIPSGGLNDDLNPRSHSDDGEYGYTYGINVTPGSLGTPYDTLVTGGTPDSNQVTIRTTAKAVFAPDNLITPTNQTALQALANALAKDFYDCQQQNITETYRGIVAFDPKAALDTVYCYWPEPMTRVSRRPLNEYPTRFGHGFGDLSTPQRVQFIKVTGAIAGGFYPAVLAPGGVASVNVCYAKSVNGAALANGTFYMGIKAKLAFNGSPAKPIFYVA